MANDVTEFTHLINLFNKLKDNQSYKLSEQNKPAANGTVPKPEPTVNGTVSETKPGFWTRMKSRWTPGIGQLPSAEDAGIKQAGKLKSILNAELSFIDLSYYISIQPLFQLLSLFVLL